jgi:hypothetical protein
VNGASVSLENVDKFLKDHHVKVRNEEPNVPNRPMDHQEPSIKFTETTLRDAWESWAKLTHPDEQGEALGIITSYAKDIARQFEDILVFVIGKIPKRYFRRILLKPIYEDQKEGQPLEVYTRIRIFEIGNIEKLTEDMFPSVENGVHSIYTPRC